MQSKRHNVDVLHISDQPSMVALIEEGHVADWKVPTHDRYPESFRLKTHAYANYSTDNAIIYNVNKVTPEEVKLLESDWKAVLDPRFKGRFAVTSMKCGACYAAIHMFVVDVDRELPRDVDTWEDYEAALSALRRSAPARAGD